MTNVGESWVHCNASATMAPCNSKKLEKLILSTMPEDLIFFSRNCIIQWNQLTKKPDSHQAGRTVLYITQVISQLRPKNKNYQQMWASPFCGESVQHIKSNTKWLVVTGSKNNPSKAFLSETTNANHLAQRWIGCKLLANCRKIFARHNIDTQWGKALLAIPISVCTL